MGQQRLKDRKRALREKMRGILRSMTPGIRRRKSLKAVGKIFGEPAYLASERIFVYASTAAEVDTRKLLKKSLFLKKKVYLPSLWKTRTGMRACRVVDPARDLRPGKFGILEPRPLTGRFCDPRRLDLILVPGLAFDAAGRRLGRGRGYFDRFLKKAPGALRWGLAFREQMIRRVPSGGRDVAVQRVFTD